MNRKTRSMLLICALVSFLGFWVENIWLAVTKGYMNNRSMYAPFLLGYGLAVLAIYFLLGTPQKMRFLKWKLPVSHPIRRWLAYYGAACLCVMAGEVALGTFVEKTCGIVWWNYEAIPLHITRYTSLPTSSLFGILITVFMGCFFSRLYKFFCAADSRFWDILAFLLVSVMTLDFLGFAWHIGSTRKLRPLWHIAMPWKGPLFHIK